MINPFRNRIVADPWRPSEIDVTEIHSNAFSLCCDVLDSVQKEGRSTSVLLYGETGSGKTHLLSRLQQHCLTLPHLHIFASVRLHTSPNRFWRHLRASIVESLFRPARKGHSQLKLIFMRRLFLLCRKRTISLRELSTLTAAIQADSRLSPGMCQALQFLMQDRHIPDIIAWLKGYSLPESTCLELKIEPPNDSDEPEDSARELILELCRLAGATIPIVLSFDQIEALQRYPKDIGGLFRFGQAIRTLHDETVNLLLITCIQTFFLDELRQALMAPDFDAMSCHSLTLDILERHQAMKLVTARIEAVIQPDFDKTRLLQVLSADVAAFTGGAGKTARSILGRCADIFDNVFSAGVTPETEFPMVSEEDLLYKEMAKREAGALNRITPEDMDELMSAILPSLIHIRNERCRENERESNGRDIDMVFVCPERTTGISLCNQRNLTSLAAKFRHLLEDMPLGESEQLLLLRHPQLWIDAPLSIKAKKYLQELQDAGARLIIPSVEILAALSALKSLLSDARSGDLLRDDRPVHEITVRRWITSLSDAPVMVFVNDLFQTGSLS